MHVIGKQIIEVSVPTRERGIQAQNEISELCAQSLMPRLEELFSSLADPDKVIRLDRLEINISRISSTHFKEDFTNKVLAALEEEIVKRKREIALASFAESDGAVGYVYENRSRDEETALGSSKIGTIIHFMKTGSLSWSALPEQLTDGKAALKKLMIHDPVAAKGILKKILTGTKEIRRFIYQFDEPSVYEAVKVLGSDSDRLVKINRELLAVLTALFPSAGRSELHLYLLERTLLLSVKFGDSSVEQLYRKYVYSVLLEIFEKRKAGDALNEEWENAGVRLSQLTDTEGRSLPLSPLVEEEVKEMLRIRRSENREAEDMRRAQQSHGDESEAEAKKKMERAEDKLLDWKISESSNEPLPYLMSQEEEHYIGNAGLVILWPFLHIFFKELGIVEEEKFVSEEAAVRGAGILQYLATGTEETAEEEMILNKILCGLEPDVPVPGQTLLNDKEKAECEDLLKSAIRHWSILQGVNPQGFRDTFLRRKGVVSRKNGSWALTVQRETLDILMDKLPWGISIIKMPWNDYMINVEW